MYLNLLLCMLIFFIQTVQCKFPKEIRVRYEYFSKYAKYYNRSFSRLLPYLKERGLSFVQEDADVIFCHEVTSDILKMNCPIIILERHGTKLSHNTLKMLAEKKVKAVFKNHIFKPIDLYREKTCMGSYFFKLINDYVHFAHEKQGLKISQEQLSKIYCVQWDFHLSNYTTRLNALKKQEIDFNASRPIDVFFVGSDYFKGASSNSNLFYGWHRNMAINAIKSLKEVNYLVRLGRPFAFDEYIRKIKKSKIVVSPWGLSEWCFRDAEAILCGAILIKPDTSFVQTIPNIFQNNRTYIPCKPDFSDLASKIYSILSQYDEYEKMRKYAWRILHDSDLEKLADHFVHTVITVLKR